MTAPSLVRCAATVLLAAVLTTACQPGAQGEPDPAPPATTSPTPDPRYGPIESTYCAELGLPDVFSEQDLLLDPDRTREHYESQTSPGRFGPSGLLMAIADCSFGTPEDGVPVPLRGSIWAGVYHDPFQAGQSYDGSAQHRAARESGDLGEGWWAESHFYELSDRPFMVAYQARHENLLIEAWVRWSGFEDPDPDQARPIFHDLLRTLLERSIEPVPLAGG